MKPNLALVVALALALAGCAFDVSFVKTEPAAFVAKPGCGHLWTLTQDVSVGVGSGFPTRLRAGTNWRCVGSTDTGEVYRTDDQIVTVEASNAYEATLILNDRMLMGFYLPVDHRIVPLSQGLSLPMKDDRS